MVPYEWKLTCLFYMCLLLVFSDQSGITSKIGLCNNAPSDGLKIICSQLQNWDFEVRHHHSASTFSATWTSWTSSTEYSDSQRRWTSSSSSWSAWSSWSTWSSWSSYASHTKPGRYPGSGYETTEAGYGRPSGAIAGAPSGQQAVQSTVSCNSQPDIKATACESSSQTDMYTYRLQTQQPPLDGQRSYYAIRSDGSAGSPYSRQPAVSDAYQRPFQAPVQPLNTYQPLSGSPDSRQRTPYSQPDRPSHHGSYGATYSSSADLPGHGRQGPSISPGYDRLPGADYSSGAVAPSAGKETRTYSSTSPHSSSSSAPYRQHLVISSSAYSRPDKAGYSSQSQSNNWQPITNRGYNEDLFSMNQKTVGPPGYHSEGNGGRDYPPTDSQGTSSRSMYESGADVYQSPSSKKQSVPDSGTQHSIPGYGPSDAAYSRSPGAAYSQPRLPAQSSSSSNIVGTYTSYPRQSNLDAGYSRQPDQSYSDLRNTSLSYTISSGSRNDYSQSPDPSVRQQKLVINYPLRQQTSVTSASEAHSRPAHLRQPPPNDAGDMGRTRSGAKPKYESGNLNPNSYVARDPSNPYECMDLLCLCGYIKGVVVRSECILPSGSKLQPALRKEYRQLSSSERERFHRAIHELKRSGEYDRITHWHSHPEYSGGAHSGPAFLPWHREFLKRFEIGLRLIDPSVALPYWDSTLDDQLEQPSDTCLFTDQLMGEADAVGNVISGFASSWQTPEGKPRLRREVGLHGRLLNEEDIRIVMSQNDVSDVLAYSAPSEGCHKSRDWTCLEYSHANVLIWVGGEMFQQITSANDPLFFLHHAFVDRIWEDWRQQKQPANERSSAYPHDTEQCSSEEHFSQSAMRPFSPLRNIDGVSEAYTRDLYTYSPRPTCDLQREESCSNEFLFCDKSHGQVHCASKIRNGGNCDGFVNGERPCLHGDCINNVCISTTMMNENGVVRTRSVGSSNAQITTESVSCFNEHECCSIWSKKGECETNHEQMLKWCKASCHYCVPSYDLQDECSDRHDKCPVWAQKDECTRNPFWMHENCRSSCERCSKKRTNLCSNIRIPVGESSL